MHHNFHKSLPFGLILFSLTLGLARQTSADQDATPPDQRKVEGQVGTPKLKSWVAPSYSREIIEKGIAGAVKLHVFLANDGTVQRVEVVDGDPLLAEVAVKAVRQWVFEPSTVGGKTVETDTTIQVSFRIFGGSTDRGAASQTATAAYRFDVEGSLMAHRLKHPVVPVYPAKAKKKHIEGTVKLRAIIATDGSVQDLKVEEGEPILAASALTAVKQWTYEPYTLDSKPVEVSTTIVVIFELAK